MTIVPQPEASEMSVSGGGSAIFLVFGIFMLPIQILMVGTLVMFISHKIRSDNPGLCVSDVRGIIHRGRNVTLNIQRRNRMAIDIEIYNLSDAK